MRRSSISLPSRAEGVAFEVVENGADLTARDIQNEGESWDEAALRERFAAYGSCARR